MAVSRWVRISLWILAACIGVSMLVGGGVAVMIYRHTTFTKSERVDAEREFERAKAQFPPRTPLVEVIKADGSIPQVRINRAPETSPRQSIDQFQVLVYDAKKQQLVRSHIPAWLMRFSSGNIAAHLGLPVQNFTITLEDVERYGRGIVIDFSPPAGGRILVWTE